VVESEPIAFPIWVLPFINLKFWKSLPSAYAAVALFFATIWVTSTPSPEPAVTTNDAILTPVAPLTAVGVVAVAADKPEFAAKDNVAVCTVKVLPFAAAVLIEVKEVWPCALVVPATKFTLIVLPALNEVPAAFLTSPFTTNVLVVPAGMMNELPNVKVVLSVADKS